MIDRYSKKAIVLACLSIFVMGIGVAACTVVPPHVSVRAPSVVVWAPVPPPAPRVEVIPPPPRHDYFWVPGYWHWQSDRHQWIDGHWEQHHEHEHYVPHRWDQDEHGKWRLNDGYWHRD